MRFSTRPRRVLALVLAGTAAVGTPVVGSDAAEAAGRPAAIRINAGGGAVVDGAGRSWLADRFVHGGTTADLARTATVTSQTATVDRSYRYGAMRYAIPVVADTDYSLRLHLTEPWFRDAGSRVFDVAVEGRTVLVKKDILAGAGRLGRLARRSAARQRATQVVQVPVRSSDGQLDVAFTNVVDKAIVSGLELVPTATSAGTSGGTSSSPSGLAMPKGNSPGYVQTFTDDFSGTKIDGTKWGRYAGQPGSDPGSQWAPSHVVVDDDVASLITYRDPAYGNKWTSGGINNSRIGALKAGKYEVRMRADAAKGINAVALLWPTAGGWPPEIDFAEDRDGDRKNFTATLHYRLDGVHKMLHGGTKTVDMTKWHTYGVEWKPGKLTYTVDGVPWKTQLSPHVPTVTMGLAIQTNAVTRGAVKPDATTPTRSQVELDWVVGYRPAR